MSEEDPMVSAVEQWLMKNPPLTVAAWKSRATAAEAENARLRAFAQSFAIQPCSCGVMHGAVTCAPCRACAALEESRNVG